MTSPLGKYPFAGPSTAQEISKIHSDLWGGLWAPETLSELMLVLSEAVGESHSVTGWRGQSDIDWRIDSGAVRRIHGTGDFQPDTPDPEETPDDLVLPEATGPQGAAEDERIELPGNLADVDPQDAETVSAQLEHDVQRYEEWLLDEARLIGHGFHEGRELSDLELLGSLQHYGAATRLIDLSRNALVALYFACVENPEKHGALVGFHAAFPRSISSEDLGRPFHQILAECPNRPITWEPRRLFERMRVQHSFFLFSEVVWSRWGTLALSGPEPASTDASEKQAATIQERTETEALDFTVIAIPPELKTEGLRVQRHALFGYDGKSLFPDLEGFSRFHSASRDFESR